LDNFGWGEPGFNGGGIIRGAPTPHTDKLASEGSGIDPPGAGLHQSHLVYALSKRNALIVAVNAKGLIDKRYSKIKDKRN
jgi:hypothetical protein